MLCDGWRASRQGVTHYSVQFLYYRHLFNWWWLRKRIRKVEVSRVVCRPRECRSPVLRAFSIFYFSGTTVASIAACCSVVGGAGLRKSSSRLILIKQLFVCSPNNTVSVHWYFVLFRPDVEPEPNPNYGATWGTGLHSPAFGYNRW